MPLYEYKCERCGQTFEVRQKFADKPLTTHNGGCGGHVERLLSVPTLQFKGSGFYITDYAHKHSSTDSSHERFDPSASKPKETPAASTPAAPAETKK